ncbi:hypothetical protein VB152_19150, partial [Xanthomonas fragariae]|nr:hypothetical protein [Xanthomonas fragariae]
VRMGGNCKKPAFSVANTGSSGTPVQTSRPCGRWVVGVFQGRLSKAGTRSKNTASTNAPAYTGRRQRVAGNAKPQCVRARGSSRFPIPHAGSRDGG